MLTDDELDRYSRHILLKQIGGSGQMRLKASKVAIVGMGGIGVPVAQYLTAAGVGRLSLIDADVISLSNLQRQVIYPTDTIGDKKLLVAKAALNALNPYTDIVLKDCWMSEENAESLLAGHDLIIDGTDRFATRHLINRVAIKLNIPLLSAAIGSFEAQLALFDGAPCYACLVPEGIDEGQSCAEIGVLGALCGVIGAMAALEATKFLAGATHHPMGRLFTINGLTLETKSRLIRPDPSCLVCAQ